MKKITYLLFCFLALVSLCYFLLFISLDITAMFMESDDDINKTGKIMLFVIPVIIIFGLWLANYIYTIFKNKEGINRLNRIFLSLYGGFFGIVISNLLIKLFTLNTNETTIFISSLFVSFIVFVAITSVLTKKYLTRK